MLVGGGAGILCWLLVVPYRLAGSTRLYLIPPVLLAVAAFVPAAVGIAAGERETLGDGQLTRILIATYLLGAATTYVFAPAQRRDQDARLLWVLLGLWLLGVLSNSNAGISAERLSFWVIPVVLVVAWRFRPTYRDAVELITWLCLVACAASLLLAYLDPGAAFTSLARVDSILSSHRLAGITEHPNLIGFFAAIGLVALLDRRGWLRSTGIAICGLVLLASDSRTAWFACAAGIVVLALGRRRQSRPFSRVQLVLGALALVVVALLALRYIAPDQGDSLTFTGRTELWAYIGEHWSESPLLGHGPAVFNSSQLFGLHWEPIHAHNQFLQTLFTTGLIGVGLLLVFVWLWTSANLRFAKYGYVLPLAFEAMVMTRALFEVPLDFSAVEANLWLLSMLVFLKPMESEMGAKHSVGAIDRAAAERGSG